MIEQAFLQNLALLLVTALVIPLMIRYVDAKRHARQLVAQAERDQEQKRFEAELSRQGKVIDAQSALVDRLADLLWEYQLLLVSVPWFQQFPHLRSEYEKSVTEYHERAGILFGTIRAEISKARRLTTPSMFEELRKLYYDRLLELDGRLARLIAIGPEVATDDGSEGWQEFRRTTGSEFHHVIDETIQHLAASLDLTQKVVDNPYGRSPVAFSAPAG